LLLILHLLLYDGLVNFYLSLMILDQEARIATTKAGQKFFSWTGFSGVGELGGDALILWHHLHQIGFLTSRVPCCTNDKLTKFWKIVIQMSNSMELLGICWTLR
jgi:hypothetical protein